ncbi:MAG: PIG-L family deacetylase [Chitinophagia bacterium]|nr:PIG-L family deacetylase [Chitinophagia bacterium]
MSRLVAIVCLLSTQLIGTIHAQTYATYTSADIFQQMKKLNVLGSVLYIAAHPDDENNTFLPYLAKEKLYRTAYLSLTRGDGGQNLIGPEQGIELGLIRTQELLAARRQDGAEQYFSRAYEFGYSKSLTEALRIWDKEKILSDAVWIIRQYQPDIIINRFPPDARAGHGHHAASAVIGAEAFVAAADPKRFPEQFAYGVKPWQAKRIVWNSYNFGGNMNTTSADQFSFDISGFNPMLGKSYGEIGAEARSMHKSQGEGRPRRRGTSLEFFSPVAGDPPKTDLMDGVDITWSRIPGGTAIQEQVNQLIRQFNFEQPEASVPALVKLYTAMQSLPESNWKNKKMQEVQQLVEACSAIFAEVTTQQEYAVQGESVAASFFFNKRKQVQATLKYIQLPTMDSSFSLALPYNQNIQFVKTIPVPANQKISQPYWLEYPKLEGSFDVRDQRMIGKAENDPAFPAKWVINIEGVDFTFQRAIQYKYVDPVKGELYQPLVVLPAAEVNFTKENLVSINGKKITAGVQLLQRGKNKLNPTIQFSGLKQFSLNGSTSLSGWDENARIYASLNSPNPATNKTVEISLQPSTPEVYAGSTRIIAYDHIPTITYFAPAKTNLISLQVKTTGKKIGYIPGAGDKIPAALEQLGYEVVVLSEADIQMPNLSQYDAIITGIRAYNIYEYLTNKNDILNRYIEAGGHLIIQYMKSNLVGLKRITAGPYPFQVNSGSRVTEENAAVTFLQPNHPLLNYPNVITQSDFEGWVQERSTYHAEQVDPHFVSILQMADTGEKPAAAGGSLITAPYGKGNITYVSLVLFRQLPAGNPGAYRILANLLALPNNKP